MSGWNRQHSALCSQAPTQNLFLFFGNVVFLCVFYGLFLLWMFLKKNENWIGGLVGGVWPIRVFLGVLDFFQLDKTPYHMQVKGVGADNLKRLEYT